MQLFSIEFKSIDLSIDELMDPIKFARKRKYEVKNVSNH